MTGLPQHSSFADPTGLAGALQQFQAPGELVIWWLQAHLRDAAWNSPRREWELGVLQPHDAGWAWDCCIWAASISISFPSGRALKENIAQDWELWSSVSWKYAWGLQCWANCAPWDPGQALQSFCILIQLWAAWPSQSPPGDFWYLKAGRAAGQEDCRTAVLDSNVLTPFQAIKCFGYRYCVTEEKREESCETSKWIQNQGGRVSVFLSLLSRCGGCWFCYVVTC